MWNCEICKNSFKNCKGLSLHILLKHNVSSKEYYDKYVKKDHEGICLVCGGTTNFGTLSKGYFRYCSSNCSCKDQNIIKRKIEGMQSACLEKYGTCNITFNSKIYEQRQKQRSATLIKRYGTDKLSCIPTFHKKAMENRNKTIKTAKQYILPSGKIIWKLGYEPQFLDYIFKNNILKEDEIQYYCKGIKYIGTDNKEHYYYPDFFIPKWNLIVEIKSDFTITLDTEINNKKNACIANGMNYIRLVGIKKGEFDFSEFCNNIGVYNNESSISN